MLNTLTSRGALAATASIAALCVGVILVEPAWRPGPPPVALPEIPPPAAPARPETLAGGGAAPLTGLRDSDAATRLTAQAGARGGETAAAEDAPAATLPAPPSAAVAEAADTMPPAIFDEPAAVIAEGAPPPPPAPSVAARKRQAETEAPGVLGFVAPEPGALAALPAGGAMPDPRVAPADNTEAFPEAEANPLKLTAEQPVSTFSVDVDTASYAVIRSSLSMGLAVDPASVRIEEMVNYFPYDYPAPAAGEAPFKASVAVFATPWNDGTRLVRIGLQGRLPAVEDRPPLNLVFLIDTSGSMDDPAKLPLLQQSLALVLPGLREGDEVAIVAYAGSAGLVLPPTAAADRRAVQDALGRLAAGGSTAGAEGLELAYRTAAGMAAEGEVSRILLATDGDFNVGISDPAGLEAYVARKRDEGTYLSVLGFGRGNLDDATMQALAQAGNGTAAYIDTLAEAQKVLVDQLAGALFPIADDVKIQVEWNPAAVAEWRLIGYETRALAREDFADDRVDAGEIGAGHQVTALYEVTAPDSPARRIEPLRYGSGAAPGGPSDELGFLRLRYKEPGEGTSRLVETPIPADTGAADADARWAAAMAGFGQLLTGGRYLGDWGWDKAIALAVAARGEDAFGYRAEAVGLMRLAQSLAR
jgi:Ca-activated chloride channel family protein